ncbi:MAG: ComEA family DNA-binding protein [Candidatus Levybacteria bacterium]|nr:ComEA family DNA-binding protein [Candidatus Levybacteria bacterium]
MKEILQDFWQEHSPLVRLHIVPLALGCIGLILIGYGLITLIFSKNSENKVVFESSDERNILEVAEKIVIDVSGSVVNPGMYSLTNLARMQDALISAGGLSGNADRKWVAKNINLAQKITDGQKIYIPSIGEVSKPIQDSKAVLGNSDNFTLNGLININSASLSDLDTLSGIGIVSAQKIIDGRPFSAIDELLKKKILSSKVFEQIKDKISVY